MCSVNFTMREQNKLERMENRLAFRQAKEQARTGHTPSVFSNPDVELTDRQINRLEKLQHKGEFNNAKNAIREKYGAGQSQSVFGQGYGGGYGGYGNPYGGGYGNTYGAQQGYGPQQGYGAQQSDPMGGMMQMMQMMMMMKMMGFDTKNDASESTGTQKTVASNEDKPNKLENTNIAKAEPAEIQEKTAVAKAEPAKIEEKTAVAAQETQEAEKTATVAAPKEKEYSVYAEVDQKADGTPTSSNPSMTISENDKKMLDKLNITKTKEGTNTPDSLEFDEKALLQADVSKLSAEEQNKFAKIKNAVVEKNVKSHHTQYLDEKTQNRTDLSDEDEKILYNKGIAYMENGETQEDTPRLNAFLSQSATTPEEKQLQEKIRSTKEQQQTAAKPVVPDNAQPVVQTNNMKEQPFKFAFGAMTTPQEQTKVPFAPKEQQNSQSASSVFNYNTHKSETVAPSAIDSKDDKPLSELNPFDITGTTIS